MSWPEEGCSGSADNRIEQLEAELADVKETAVKNLGRAFVAENELAEFKRQIAEGELAYADAVYALSQKLDGRMNYLSVQEFLKRYAADQARKDAQ